MEEEEENNNGNSATGIEARIVYVKNSIVNIHAGGINRIFSSLNSVSVTVGILAVICALVFGYWTITPSNTVDLGLKAPNGVQEGDHQNLDDSAKDEPVIADQKEKPETPTASKIQSKEIKPSWEAVRRVLAATTPLVPETVDYGGHTFVCEARSPYFHKFQMRWKGKCTDKETGFVVVCKGCLSPTTSVERAAAQLIRDMVSQNKYPEPSETKAMPSECNC